MRAARAAHAPFSLRRRLGLWRLCALGLGLCALAAACVETDPPAPRSGSRSRVAFAISPERRSVCVALVAIAGRRYTYTVQRCARARVAAWAGRAVLAPL